MCMLCENIITYNAQKIKSFRHKNKPPTHEIKKRRAENGSAQGLYYFMTMCLGIPASYSHATSPTIRGLR